MKTVAVLAGITALANAHATWQQLWKNGEDLESSCARLPSTNSPIEDYSSTALQCNVNPAAASGKCSFTAGDTVTIEMHQQTSSRNCKEEGIGGAHWGPVMAYLSKVEDAATADGSSEFFKIYENGWKKAPGSSQGDADFWGTKDLNYNCGKLDFTIPEDIAAGDYLLRAEAVALHAASSAGGAQHYVTCYQLKVTGDGTATPKGVKFPEAYSKTGTGLGFSIHAPLDSYPMPGPALYERGTKVEPQLLTFGEIKGIATATGGASAPATSAAAASSKAPAATSAAATSAAPATSAAATSAVAKPTATEAATSAAAPSSTAAPETGDKKYNINTLSKYLEAQSGSDAEFSMSSFIAWLEKLENGSAAPSASEVAAEPTVAQSSAAAAKPTSAAAASTTLATVTKPQPTGSNSGSGATVQAYGQCGGQSYTGSTACVSGWTCKAQNPYYSQCVQGEGSGNSNGNGNGNAAQPTAAQPTATKPTAVASSPVISKEAVKPTASAAPAADKLWTMEELIAFLEKAE